MENKITKYDHLLPAGVIKHIEKRTWVSKDLTFHMGYPDKNNSYEHMYHIWYIIHTNMHVCNKETKPIQNQRNNKEHIN